MLETVKHKKAIISGLIVIALVSFILLAGMGFVFWKLNSYTAGNWLVEEHVRNYLERTYPDLDYEIVSKEIFETEADTPGRVLIVWKYTIKCDNEMYTLYSVSNQTTEREPMYWNVADYSQIYFDYDENSNINKDILEIITQY